MKFSSEMSFVKGSLVGEVSFVIAPLNATEKNYFAAQEFLRKRYEQPR